MSGQKQTEHMIRKLFGISRSGPPLAEVIVVDKDYEQWNRGSFSQTAGKGVQLLSTNTRANGFFCDDGGEAASGNLRNVLARTLLTIDHTAGLSVRSITGQVKFLAGIDCSSGNSVIAGVFGYLEFAGISSQAGQVAAGEFTIEIAGDITNTGAIFGVASRLNAATGKSIDGVSAAFFAGLTGDDEGDNWHAALHINGCDNVLAFASSTSYEDGIKATAQTVSSSSSHVIRVDIHGTPGYIAVFAAESL